MTFKRRKYLINSLKSKISTEIQKNAVRKSTDLDFNYFFGKIINNEPSARMVKFVKSDEKQYY